MCWGAQIVLAPDLQTLELQNQSVLSLRDAIAVKYELLWQLIVVVLAPDLQTLDDYLSAFSREGNNVLVAPTSFPDFVQDLSCALSLPPYIFLRTPLRAWSCYPFSL
jgi:hypothetical protein